MVHHLQNVLVSQSKRRISKSIQPIFFEEEMTDDKARDAAAEEYEDKAGHYHGAEDFKAGWDACAKQQFINASKEEMKNATGLLGTLSAENERLNAGVTAFKYAADQNSIATIRWREQAEALAPILRNFVDYGGGFKSDIDRGTKAIAEFEEFKKDR